MSLSAKAVDRTRKSSLTYCKFVTPNEVGLTGSHQSGILVGKSSYKILFSTPGEKGENKDRENVTICWQEDFETSSRFIYYGVGTRNEYRITRFGRNFDLLDADSLGSLFVLCKEEDGYYYGYILSADEDIDSYLTNFNLLPTEANCIVDTGAKSSDIGLDLGFLENLKGEFPTTGQLSEIAQDMYMKNHRSWSGAIGDPDSVILSLIDLEYTAFKYIEEFMYQNYLNKSFDSVEELVKVSNTILNRRKSRAGRSLENHLAKIFDVNKLLYSEQKVTEGNKRPDFIMPSVEAYRDSSFHFEGLTFLGVKTTCKDRWRQVLNEANRIRSKHLFTLQPGISSSQIQEMTEENLTLVVPRKNLPYFESTVHDRLMCLDQFIRLTKKKQSTYWV